VSGSGARQTDLWSGEPCKGLKRSFDLEMMGGASAAGGFLVELPYPVRWQGLEGETSAAAQAMAFNQVQR
jgi:hypothetical protein